MSGNTKKIPKQNRKKVVGETLDVIDAMGHENEKEGIKHTKYFMELWDKQQWEEGQIKQEKLSKASRFSRRAYHELISNMLGQELQDLDYHMPGYMAWSEFNKEGVIVKLIDRFGKKYNRAFKPSGIPKVDFKAVAGLLFATQDKIDEVEVVARENLEAMGVLLPDQKLVN